MISRRGRKGRRMKKLQSVIVLLILVLRTSDNGREIIFAAKYIESLKPEIERLEREVSE